ncbi:MAG: GNAT family N-acetyltransferase [Armatimonadetes bacterium]|nr:GNAT family N-acetyltransferase [Armatimonadota bacterium]MDE2205518.1 GNAT family N-acetyltransferase [Armatimonadota bacterium]
MAAARPGGPALRVEAHTERDSLEALRPAWQALQQSASDATPYQTWEWVEAWWQVYHARKRFLLLALYSGSELVALAPMYVSRHLRTPLRRLAWAGTGRSDYLGPLIAPGYHGEVVSALLGYMRNELSGWDYADLQQLPPHSPMLAGAVGAGEPLPDRHVSMMEPCPYLSLPASHDDFLASLGKSMRSNLRYYARLAARETAEPGYRLANAESLHADLDALFTLHGQRWNARLMPGVLSNCRVQLFHREVAARFLERGWLRLHILSMDEKAQAALYCFSFQKRLYYYLGGFAPEMARYSLGTLLTGEAIRCAIDEGCCEFDFLRGGEPYKARWKPEVRINHRLILLREYGGSEAWKQVAGRAGLLVNQCERVVERTAKRMAANAGRSRAKTTTRRGEEAATR